ncbi:hypothetical protein HS7_00070 [Sulfolobales archaeon HS-7]|nr:hypothetical protein HS7_00070 [Sulfolobales archaeon HS-7]
MRAQASVIGGVVIITLLAISLSLMYYEMNGQTQLARNELDRLSQPRYQIVEFDTSKGTEIASDGPVTITYLIYPGGVRKNVSIVLDHPIPVNCLTDGNPWVIVVDSQGEWFNISDYGSNVTNLLASAELFQNPAPPFGDYDISFPFPSKGLFSLSSPAVVNSSGDAYYSNGKVYGPVNVVTQVSGGFSAQWSDSIWCGGWLFTIPVGPDNFGYYVGPMIAFGYGTNYSRLFYTVAIPSSANAVTLQEIYNPYRLTTSGTFNYPAYVCQGKRFNVPPNSLTLIVGTVVSNSTACPESEVLTVPPNYREGMWDVLYDGFEFFYWPQVMLGGNFSCHFEFRINVISNSSGSFVQAWVKYNGEWLPGSGLDMIEQTPWNIYQYPSLPLPLSCYSTNGVETVYTGNTLPLSLGPMISNPPSYNLREPPYNEFVPSGTLIVQIPYGVTLYQLVYQ